VRKPLLTADFAQIQINIAISDASGQSGTDWWSVADQSSATSQSLVYRRISDSTRPAFFSSTLTARSSDSPTFSKCVAEAAKTTLRFPATASGPGGCLKSFCRRRPDERNHSNWGCTKRLAAAMRMERNRLASHDPCVQYSDHVVLKQQHVMMGGGLQSVELIGPFWWIRHRRLSCHILGDGTPRFISGAKLRIGPCENGGRPAISASENLRAGYGQSGTNW